MTLIRLSFGSYVKLITGCLAISIGGSLIVAFGWRGTVNDSAVVVIGVERRILYPTLFLGGNIAVHFLNLTFASSPPFSPVRPPDRWWLVFSESFKAHSHSIPGRGYACLTVFALLLPSAVAWGLDRLRGGGGRRRSGRRSGWC